MRARVDCYGVFELWVVWVLRPPKSLKILTQVRDIDGVGKERRENGASIAHNNWQQERAITTTVDTLATVQPENARPPDKYWSIQSIYGVSMKVTYRSVSRPEPIAKHAPYCPLPQPLHVTFHHQNIHFDLHELSSHLSGVRFSNVGSREGGGEMGLVQRSTIFCGIYILSHWAKCALTICGIYRMPDELCQIVAFEDAKLGSWARKRHVAAPLSETSPPKITGREPFI